MKYYILCGEVGLDEPISNFMLIAPSRVTKRYNLSTEQENDAIRIDCDKSFISKCSCDNYATTKEKTLVKDTNPEVFTRIDSKWAKNDELTKDYLAGKVQPYEFGNWLEDHGYKYAGPLGYSKIPYDFDAAFIKEKKLTFEYLRKTHPELDSLMLSFTAKNLMDYIICKDDKGFEQAYVKTAINKANQTMKRREVAMNTFDKKGLKLFDLFEGLVEDD